MADQTLTPEQIQARLGSLLSTATAHRNSLLQSFAADAQQEAASVRKLRDAVAQTAGASDPTVQALDRRAAGTDQVTTFTQKTLDAIGPQATPPPLGDWVVAGLVLDAKGKSVAGAKITLTGDADLAKRFGEVTSDKAGKFEVRFPGAEMKDVFARAPKVKLTARSKDGKLQTTTAEIVPKSDGIDLLEIRFGKPADKDDDKRRDDDKRGDEKDKRDDDDKRPAVKKAPAAGKKAT